MESCCPICYEDLNLYPVIKLECNHIFHKKCFTNYIMFYLSSIGFIKNDENILTNVVDSNLNIQYKNRNNILKNKKCPYCRSEIDIYSKTFKHLDFTLYSKRIDEFLSLLLYEDNVDSNYLNSCLINILQEDGFLPIKLFYLIILKNDNSISLESIFKLFNKTKENEKTSIEYICILPALMYYKNFSSNALIEIVKQYYNLNVFVDNSFEMFKILIQQGFNISKTNYYHLYKFILFVNKLVGLISNKYSLTKMTIYNILLSDVYLFRIFYHECLANYDYNLLEEFLSNELIVSNYCNYLELIYLPKKYKDDIDYENILITKIKENETKPANFNKLYHNIYTEKFKLNVFNKSINIIYLTLINIRESPELFKKVLNSICIKSLQNNNTIHIDLCDLLQECQHRSKLEYYHHLFEFIQKLNLTKNIQEKFIKRLIQLYSKRIKFDIISDFIYIYVYKHGLKSLDLHNLYIIGDSILYDILSFIINKFTHKKKIITDYLKYLVENQENFLSYIIKSFPNVVCILYRQYKAKYIIKNTIKYDGYNTTLLHLMFYYSPNSHEYLDLVEMYSDFKMSLVENIDYLDEFGRNIFETLIIKNIPNKYIFVRRFILCFIENIDLNKQNIYNNNIGDLLDFAKL